jgi:hypothetical protein
MVNILKMELHAIYDETVFTAGLSPEDANEEIVRRVVNKTDNPHPIILMCVIITILIVLYYIYIILIKDNFSGEWYDGNSLVNVAHNKWNDTILVDNFTDGYVVGNAIYLEKGDKIHVGTLYKKSIYWLGDGSVWTRPSNII